MNSQLIQILLAGWHTVHTIDGAVRPNVQKVLKCVQVFVRGILMWPKQVLAQTCIFSVKGFSWSQKICKSCLVEVSPSSYHFSYLGWLLYQSHLGHSHLTAMQKATQLLYLYVTRVSAAHVRSGYVNMLECLAKNFITHPQNQGFELPFNVSEISKRN